MRDAETIVVALNRLGTPEVEVSLPEEATIQDALNKAEWSLAANEKCFVDAVAATADSILDDGDTIQIVGNKAGGNL